MLDKYGHEIPDPKPLSIPSGLKQPESLQAQIKRLVRSERLAAEAAAAGAETFDEAEDFNIPDDPVDPNTPFEEYFEPAIGRAITPAEMNKFEAVYRRRFLEEQKQLMAQQDAAEGLSPRQMWFRRLFTPKASGAQKSKNEGTNNPPDDGADS